MTRSDYKMTQLQETLHYCNFLLSSLVCSLRHHVRGLHHHDPRLRGLHLPFEAAALAAPRARHDAKGDGHDATDDDSSDDAGVQGGGFCRTRQLNLGGVDTT